MAAFKDLAAAKRGGTITITKEKDNQKSAEEAMKVLEKGSPRSTFSLFDLFGMKRKNPKPKNGAVVKGPPGVPVLSSWSANDDGTVTGVISGSPNIEDGDMITTSPIADGKMKKLETITTISGSKYYLG